MILTEERLYDRTKTKVLMSTYLHNLSTLTNIADGDLHFSSRLSFFCEYLIVLAQRGKNRSGD